MKLEVIELRNKIVNNDQIKVDCEHTSFCNISRIEFPDITDLEKKVKKLRKDLKLLNVKLNKSNTLSLLKEKSSYNYAVNEYNNIFNTLVHNWKYTLENDLLYVGYGSSTHYINNLRDIKFKLEVMNSGNNIAFKIKAIEYRVNEIIRELENGTKYISITI